MCGAIDDELIRLSAAAGKAAQMSDLLTLARLQALVLELSLRCGSNRCPLSQPAVDRRRRRQSRRCLIRLASSSSG